MTSLELFSYLIQLVGVGALIRISHNTGKMIQRLEFVEKLMDDHEKRIRKLESLKTCV